MTSVFRTAGAWGSGLGRPLTWSEQDTMMYDKETRITDLESLISVTGGGAVGIANIEIVASNQLVITMTDSSVYTFTLPSAAAWIPQGAWQPSTLYQQNDVIYDIGGAYLVNADHTSATSFDPNEIGGTFGELYTLILPYLNHPSVAISTATFTPGIEHANSYIRCTNAAGCTVTIPAFADVPFSLDTELQFRDATTTSGGGGITFSPDSGVTLNIPEDRFAGTSGIGHTVFFKNIAEDVWDVGGGLIDTTV